MKKMIAITFIVGLVITSLLLLQTGCSNRLETPFTESDSTIVYPSKTEEDILAKITFCRKADKDTDDRIGAGMVFSLMKNANVRAFIDIGNRFTGGNHELMFHVDWIGPDGSSFYMKRIDLPLNDTTTTIQSSISISPEGREAGEYTLKVYSFRELIAEKKFEILPELQIDETDKIDISANITLYRKTSKKTGKLIGEGTTFTIKNKENVRALIELENRFAYGEQELIFNIDWVGPDGASFYNKRINLFPDDSTSVFNSSISISPGKREAGTYMLRVSLFDKAITEQGFELLSEK